jgi:hypothetical protein
MSYGEPRPQRCPVATVEREQFFGRPVLQSRRDTSTDVAACPCTAETLALETEKSQFVERVRRPQGGIELQAVDDAQRVTEKDMFRTQVAMGVDDAPRPHAVDQKRSAAGEEQPLRAVYAPDQTGRHAEARIQKDALIVDQASSPSDEMPEGRDENRCGTSIELHQCVHQPINLPGFHAAPYKRPIEHLVFVETTHDDEPVDDVAGSPDGESCRGRRQRNDIEINARGQPAIEL